MHTVAYLALAVGVYNFRHATWKFGQLTFMWLWKLGVARCLEDITDGRIECVGQTTLARKESGPAQLSEFQHL